MKVKSSTKAEMTKNLKVEGNRHAGEMVVLSASLSTSIVVLTACVGKPFMDSFF